MNNEAVGTVTTTADEAVDEINAVDESTEVPAESPAKTVSGLIDQQIIRVPLTQLRPFSGTLYDEHGNPVPVSGNPFYVPEDYLPLLPSSTPTAASSVDETADTASSTDEADTESAESAEKTENADVAGSKLDKDILSMRSLHASIEQEGILTPLLVRPATENGFYEILSGYRRKRVCEVLAQTRPEFQLVPVIVVAPCDDDTASSIITSANVQRREVSFLETIKSCGQMYRALRHRGRKQTVQSGQIGREADDSNNSGEEQGETGVTTASIVSQILGLKPRTVQRYSQLLELPDRMLTLVGRKAKNAEGVIRLPIRAGEVLSNVSKEKLSLIEEVVTDSKNANTIITESTAKAIRKYCTLNREISKKEIEKIIKEQQQKQKAKKKAGKKAGGSKKKSGAGAGGFLLDENRLRKFCGNKMTEKEVAELIYGLVEKWSEGQK